MSATKTRTPAAEAKAIAARLIERLEPSCDRIVVAGSLRRGLPTAGDIELVCVPKVERMPVTDLFGDTVSATQVDLLDAELDLLVAHGIVAKRPRSDGKTFWGPKAKYMTFEGMNVDLFSAVNDWRKARALPTAETERFGLILMIRTGPAAYSHQLVTERGKPLVVGHEPNGRPITRVGLLPPHLRVQDGWLTYRTSGERIPTPEESDFYGVTGLPFMHPWERR